MARRGGGWKKGVSTLFVVLYLCSGWWLDENVPKEKGQHLAESEMHQQSKIRCSCLSNAQLLDLGSWFLVPVRGLTALPKSSRVRKLGVPSTPVFSICRVSGYDLLRMLHVVIRQRLSNLHGKSSVELSVGIFRLVATEIDPNIQTCFDIYVLYPIQDHNHRLESMIIR